jgi:uncharacterized protein (DUF4213/DUF364 family)
MPSDISKQIVQQIYDADRASAIDSINDALGAATYNAIQARKLEFAKSMGFDLDDTAQDAADEIADSLPDVGDVEDAEVDQRQPHEPPLCRGNCRRTTRRT